MSNVGESQSRVGNQIASGSYPSKVGFLRRAARFLGFGRIRVVASVRRIPRGTGLSATPLAKRDVQAGLKSEPVISEKSPLLQAGRVPDVSLEEIQRASEGYRANRVNLFALQELLVNNEICKKHDESDGVFKQRVRLALVASGFGSYGKSGELRSRRQFNKPMTAEQFARLGEALNSSMNQLVADVHRQKHVDKASLLNNQVICAALGESAGLSQFSTGEEFYTRHQLLRDYFTIGEGYETLSNLNYVNKDTLKSLIPDLTLEKVELDQDLLKKINQSLSLELKNNDSSGVVTGSPVEYRGTIKCDYDHTDPLHRCLALVQELNVAFSGGYTSALVDKYLLDPYENNEVEAERVREVAEGVKNLYVSVTQKLLKAAFPDDMNENGYKQVVFTNPGTGSFQVNTDVAQPRGGWTENQKMGGN